MSFSHDGSTMAFASLEWRSTLFRQGFDAAREALVGAPVPVLRGSRPIRDHEISPDGQWIAFNESRTQEDLFVARADGSEYRRLTDDAARDRGPSWSPDGSRIAFYSDRGGHYDLWTIRPDGSHAEQVTKDLRANFGIWSPQGDRLAFSGIGVKSATIVSSTAREQTSVAAEPPINETDNFWPFSWSPDGRRLVGIQLTPRGTVSGLVVYDVVAKQYRSVPAPLDRSGWILPAWIADGRRVLLRTQDGIQVVNTDTGVLKNLVTVRGYMIGRSMSLAKDNTWFSYTDTGTEGDVWVANLTKSQK
jgi:Tol biopolymer transport system component